MTDERDDCIQTQPIWDLKEMCNQLTRGCVSVTGVAVSGENCTCWDRLGCLLATEWDADGGQGRSRLPPPLALRTMPGPLKGGRNMIGFASETRIQHRKSRKYYSTSEATLVRRRSHGRRARTRTRYLSARLQSTGPAEAAVAVSRVSSICPLTPCSPVG